MYQKRRQTAFFVKVEPSQGDENVSDDDVDCAISVLTIGKRIGLSLDEMNVLTVQDVLDMAKAYSGKEEKKVRKATQKDIDAFFK